MESGIPDYFSDERFQEKFLDNHCRNWLPAELFAIGATGQQLFEPGTKLSYSNTNTVILGLIIERITKNSLEKEIIKRIIKPLKLSETKFETCSILDIPHMNGYQYVNGKLKDVTNHNVSWSWAAGNISSNLHDASKFVKYAIGKHLLLEENATKQQRKWTKLPNSLAYGLKISYGFQLLKLENFIGHYGSIPGYNTFIIYEIKTNTTLVIAVNVDVNKNNIPVADRLAEYIVARLNNKITFDDVDKIFISQSTSNSLTFAETYIHS